MSAVPEEPSVATGPATPSGSAADLGGRGRRALLVGLVLAVALGWRLLGITNTEVWRDEAISIIHTRASWWDLLTRLHCVEDSPPLWFLVLKDWASLVSEEWQLRLLPIVIGVVAVAVIMKTAWLIAPRSWWAAGLLAGLSQMPVHYSQELRVYSLLFLLAAISFLAAEYVAKGVAPRFWMFVFALAGILAAYGHGTAIFLFPSAAMYVVVRRGRWGVRRLLAPYAAPLWGICVIPVLLFGMSWTAFHRETGEWWVWSPTPASLKWNAEEYFGLSMVTEWSRHAGLVRMWSAFALERIMILAPAVLVIFGLIDAKTRRPILGLAIAACTYLAGLLASSWIALPCIMDRTLLAVWAPVVLLISVGAGAQVSRGMNARRLAVGALAVLFAVGWTWKAYAGPVRRHPSQEAFWWMREQLRPDDIIISVPHWFEDQTVYRLSDLVSAEQLFSRGVPVYAGRPPVHQFRVRVPDSQWLDRIGSAIEARAKAGVDYSVWIVQFGPQSSDAAPETIQAFVARNHRCVAAFSGEEFGAASINRYVPRGRQTTSPSSTVPASRPGPASGVP